MGFTLVPCPGLYMEWKNKNPEKFVEMCEAFISYNNRGMKAVGFKTIGNGEPMIITMPDYDADKPIVTFKQVKGKKTKEVTHEKIHKVPIECYLDDDDFAYLKSKGRDKYGRKVKTSK